ncbi:putative GTP binding protein [Pseudohyphozyma bogoriensis]|nr:putative GTP binding protein [Pseudohyphozyma bogoriensis]
MSSSSPSTSRGTDSRSAADEALTQDQGTARSSGTAEQGTEVEMSDFTASNNSSLVQTPQGEEEDELSSQQHQSGEPSSQQHQSDEEHELERRRRNVRYAHGAHLSNNECDDYVIVQDFIYTIHDDERRDLFDGFERAGESREHIVGEAATSIMEKERGKRRGDQDGEGNEGRLKMLMDVVEKEVLKQLELELRKEKERKRWALFALAMANGALLLLGVVMAKTDANHHFLASPEDEVAIVVRDSVKPELEEPVEGSVEDYVP